MTLTDIVAQLPPGIAEYHVLPRGEGEREFLSLSSWLANGDGLVAYLERDGDDYYLTDHGSTLFNSDTIRYDLCPEDFVWQNRIAFQCGVEFKPLHRHTNDCGTHRDTEYPEIVRRKLTGNVADDVMKFAQACLLLDVYWEQMPRHER